MSLFPSVLVPLDGSRIAARSLGCATWLTQRLGAKLHILSATPHALPAREALAQLQVPKEYWPHIMLHQAPEFPSEAILEAIKRHAVRMLVISARGEAAETDVSGQDVDPLKIVGHVTHSVIEQSPIPVLLLPPRYQESLPWKSLLVPTSGEAAGDQAVALAARLAAALDIKARVAHVTDGEAMDAGIEGLARYADAVHHEYPRLLEEFVTRALPQCSHAECACIEGISLCRGDVVSELGKLIREGGASVLIIGWHGQFMTGHARVLKQLLLNITGPVLLVKAPPAMPFRLKVGEELDQT